MLHIGRLTTASRASRDLGDDALRLVLGAWSASEQQWPHEDLAGEAVADHRIGDALQGAGLGRAALVDMEVEVEALRRRRPGRSGRARGRCVRPGASPEEGDAARERRRVARWSRRRAGTGPRRRAARSIGKQRHRLERDAVRAIPRAARRRPARRSRSAARWNRDGCGSRRCRGRRRSAAQKSMRARTSSADQFASRSRAGVVERAQEGAVRVRAARPDVALVEMGVDVDEARAGRCRRRDRGPAGPSSRVNVPAGDDGGDAAVLDRDVDRAQALRVRRRARSPSRARAARARS